MPQAYFDCPAIILNLLFATYKITIFAFEFFHESVGQ